MLMTPESQRTSSSQTLAAGKLRTKSFSSVSISPYLRTSSTRVYGNDLSARESN